MLNPEHRIKQQITMAKMVKKLDSKLQNQQQRKYNKDENLENYDSEVQMYVRAHSGPRLAD